MVRYLWIREKCEKVREKQDRYQYKRYFENKTIDGSGSKKVGGGF